MRACKSLISSVTLLGILLVGLSFAYAGDAVVAATDTPLGAALARLISEVVYPAIAGILAVVVGLAMRKLSAKWGGDALMAQQQLIETVALQGIAFAEEKAVAYAKTCGAKLPGGDKLNLAAAKILDAVPGLSVAQAKSAAESMLARTAGIGATGSTAVIKAG